MAVPRFVLQPLVENAIRHGIAQLPAGGTIRMQTRVAAEDVEILIENDMSLKRDARSGVPGLGLSNTRERLAQIYGTQASVVSRRATDSFFAVVLSIPIDRKASRGGDL